MAGPAPSPHATQISSPLQASYSFAPNSPSDLRIVPANMSSQNYPPLPSQARNGSQGGARGSGEHRRTVSGSVNGNSGISAPPGTMNHVNSGQPRNMSGISPFDGPRSPPNNKNTSHVPCKFFRQGTCQAGKACPFSHATDNTTDHTPCKYFAKGNCKFGAKCALAHILPDGRRVNRHTLPSLAGGHLNLGGRVNPDNYQHQQSALANSLLQANNMSPYGPQYPYPNPEDFPSSRQPQAVRSADSVPIIDTNLASNPGSKYGSPLENERFAFSPKHLTALDAPMPASFESNGISWNARYGPVAASVPSKFGLESPPHSFPRNQNLPSHALRNLHDSAFGDSQPKTHATGSSPPVSTDEPISLRAMHSQRLAQPSIMSVSVPRQPANAEWDEDDPNNLTFEEDLVPNSLHELLTPQEKMRRYSRTEEDSASRRISRGPQAEASSAVGSPSAASPSRFGPLFTRQRREEDLSPSAHMSAFGHVGSPLRNSSLNASSRQTASGDSSPYFASPPRNSSMSMISQQLQRTRLSKTDGSDGNLHPASAARFTGSSRLERVASSGPGGSTGLGRPVTSIDEEKDEFVFTMEEEEKGGWSSGALAGTRSPKLGQSKSGSNSFFSGR